MRNRFQLGFLLGSLIPLAAICVLGHSERVCFAAGAGFLLVPALLWPRKLAGWLSGLGGFYERVTLRPAGSGRLSEWALEVHGFECLWVFGCESKGL